MMDLVGKPCFMCEGGTYQRTIAVGLRKGKMETAEVWECDICGDFVEIPPFHQIAYAVQDFKELIRDHLHDLFWPILKHFHQDDEYR